MPSNNDNIQLEFQLRNLLAQFLTINLLRTGKESSSHITQPTYVFTGEKRLIN